jgi:HD-GYP domain-containing protein (c-di-GMP phosphodiesterase class II)
MIKQHPVKGELILKSVKRLRSILTVVRHHHERVDGKGYPDRLKGDEIPLPARIVAVADAFDAMISDRPYRKGLSVEEAIRRLEDGKGSQFDPLVVDTFVGWLRELMRRKGVDVKSALVG